MRTKLFYYGDPQHEELVKKAKPLKMEEEEMLFRILEENLFTTKLSKEQLACLGDYIECYKKLKEQSFETTVSSNENSGKELALSENLLLKLKCGIEDAITFLSLGLEDAGLSAGEVELVQSWLNYYQLLLNEHLFKPAN